MGNYSVEKEAYNAAFDFVKKREELERQQDIFDKSKEKLYSTLDEYFSRYGGKKTIVGGDELDQDPIVINRIEKTEIVWDAEKLEKRLEKSIRKKVIRKKYSVPDMAGLVEYLKTCGVDPKEFKKYIYVEKSVDEKEINRLGDTGYITTSQINGCYNVKCNKPYYTVSRPKGEK